MKMLNPPVTVRNLAAWFVAGDSTTPSGAYAVLEEAIHAGETAVHETGNVNELLIENLGPRDVFLHIGDLVRGGRQDRTIGVDFIVPADSGRVPIPAFCVEQARWHRRGRESAAMFSKSSHLSSARLRAKMSATKNQGHVWQDVAEEQGKLSANLGQSVSDEESPTSLMLSYENKAMAGALADYEAALEPPPPAGATGVVWVVNGRPDHADLYGSPDLLAKLWRKLRVAAATEALAALRAPAPSAAGPSGDELLAWLSGGDAGEERREHLPPRTSVRTRRGRVYEVETTDTAHGRSVHRSLVAAENLQ